MKTASPSHHSGAPGLSAFASFPTQGQTKDFFDLTPLTRTRSCELGLYLASDNYYFKGIRSRKMRIYKVAEV
jgi:hypothetical protein